MTRCLRCTANVTNLALAPVIERHFAAGYGGLEAYELSTYGSLLTWLNRHFSRVTTSEYMPQHPIGAVIGSIRNEDVQRLSFSDGSFDLVTCNQVFEHVPNDIGGFGECRRVLRPGGALVFAVPIYDTPATEEKAYIDDQGGVRVIGHPEYHDSRLGGPKSALTFRRYSKRDICSRVLAAGFSHAELVDVELSKAQRGPQVVVYAVR